MTVIIPTKLKNMVERYLMASDRRLEMGGYFFGSNDVLRAFLPIPNHSDKPHNSYSVGSNTRHYAAAFSRMIGEPIVADMHTHPNGTMPSEQDGKYVRNITWPYHILITDKQASFEWFVVDPQLRHILHVHNDVEIEAYTEAVCAEAGLECFGQVFLTPKGEIVGKPQARTFLTIDQDAYRLDRWLKSRQNTWNKWTYAEASRALGISADRVKKAKTKLVGGEQR